MNEIKVGEYVRTRGIIGKLIRIEFDEVDVGLKWYVLDINKSKRIFVNKPYIEKHSKNIIDLIEVGDYVNGKEVKHIAMFEWFPDYLKLIFTAEKKLLPHETCENKEIKTIWTKEELQNIGYKIEEEK